jgi:hypothetical protein
MRQTERDLRSLDRRSMHSIFAQLDPSERLPREYLEKARFRIYKDEPGWGHLASFLWPPAAMLVVGIAMTRFASVFVALMGTALLFVVFAWFILHRRGA